MTNEEVGRVMRLFLSSHPEHISGVRNDKEHGYVMDTQAAVAFAKWSAKHTGQKAKANRLVRFLKDHTGS